MRQSQALPLIVLVAIAAVAAVAEPRGARMYLASGRTDENMQAIRQAKGGVTGVYMCCNLASVAANGTATSPKDADAIRTEVNAIRAAIREQTGVPDAEVWHTVTPSQLTVQSGTWRAAGAPAALAQLAGEWNSTGILIDYEPSTNYSQAHADAYGAFLGGLAAAMAPRKVGMDIAGWGLLKQKYWPSFAGRGLARFTSMTPTYTGTDVPGDEAFVAEALSGPLKAEAVAFGLGTEVAAGCTAKWSYNWTEPRLRAFLANASAAGARGVDLWRADIDSYCPSGTAQWMLDAVRDFVAGRL